MKALEDALVKVTRGKTFDGFPGRPGYGTMGKAIILRTNYFHLRTAYESNQLDMEKTLYRYNVDVIPATKDQEMSRPHRRRLMEQIVALEKFAGVTYATDFSRIIVTTTELDLDDGKRWEAKLTLSNGSASGKPPSNINLDPPGSNPPGFVQAARDRNSHRFALTYGGSFSVRHLIEYLKSTSAGAEYQSRVDIIQLLNIIMAKPPNENSHVVNVGQNTFYPCGIHPGTQSKSLGGGLDALRGYFCSVRPAIGRVLINMNATHGAFFKALPLIELLEDFNNRDLEQQETFIRMLKVKARYVKDGTKEPFMEKTKSVVGFAQTPRGGIQVKRFGNARDVKFRYTDRNNPGAAEREVSVYDYFRTHHGITLEHPQLPVLNVATRSDPQYLPQELCTVLPGQAYRRLLSGDQTTLMLHFAARYPNRNAISIAGDQSAPGHGVRMYRLRASQTDPDPQKLSVEPFGFNVNTDMISVPGRILAAPQISYKGKGVSPRLGSWNCANQAFSTPGGFTKWGALVLNCPGPRGRAMQDDGYGGTVLPEECFKELAKHLNDYGLKMGLRAPTQALQLSNLTRDNRDANDNTLEKAFAKASSDQIRMLFIVLPDVDRWLYARIKFFADTKYGFHTICAVGRKLQKSQGQGMFLGNLALKFNIKGGGVNHNVQNTLTKPLDNRNMLMGLDVTHPSPGSSDGAPSIACVVASVDQSLYQWPGSVRRQTPQREMMGDRRLMNRPNTINSLTEMVLERLELWRKKNKSLPTKVVVYRDGVSEGQYSLVLQHELPSFEEAFGKLYGARDRWPKMSIIVVGKRHHTRFYPTRQEDAGQSPSRHTSCLRLITDPAQTTTPSATRAAGTLCPAPSWTAASRARCSGSSGCRRTRASREPPARRTTWSSRTTSASRPTSSSSSRTSSATSSTAPPRRCRSARPPTTPTC